MKRTLAFIVFFAVVLYSVHSYAQRPALCLPQELMESRLNDGGEHLFMMGAISQRPMLVQIYLNPTTRVWTAVVLNTTNMRACIAAHGDEFETTVFKRKEHKHGA